MPKFIKYDKKANQLVVDTQQATIGVYMIEITLKDGKDRRKQYLIKFSLQEPFNTKEYKLNKEDDPKLNERGDNLAESPDGIEKKYFNAKIKEFDAEGNCKIVFSKPLRPKDLLSIKQSLQLYIEPSDQTAAKIDAFESKATFWNIGNLIDLPEEFRSLSNRQVVNNSDYLNFTWEPLSLYSQQIDLKVDFKYKLNISTSETARDKLVIIFSEPLKYRAVDTSFL